MEKNDFIEELKWRGLIYQKTPEIEKAFSRGATLYLGIDPTADSLHLGHLLGYLILKRAFAYKNKIIILVGGGTSQIGDPGGKDQERQILPKETIEKNKEKLKKQISRFFSFDDQKVRMVDNADWLENLSLIEFLREAGKYASINSMFDLESVKTRMEKETGISYAEFSYQLLQAYDFFVLFEKYSCEVQIGGSDQWGNIVQGVELIRKKAARQAFGLSFPLIVNPKTGKKFGKTEAGQGIWLDPEKTHPFAFYQFLINVDDDLASVLLRYYSFKSKNEINILIQTWEKNKEERLLQKELAYELTALVHGREIAIQARKVAEILFTKDSSKFIMHDFLFIKKALPYQTIASAKEFVLENLLPLLGLVTSKSEARRLIQQNGVKSELLFDKYYLIRKGKKDYGVVEIKG